MMLLVWDGLNTFTTNSSNVLGCLQGRKGGDGVNAHVVIWQQVQKDEKSREGKFVATVVDPDLNSGTVFSNFMDPDPFSYSKDGFGSTQV